MINDKEKNFISAIIYVHNNEKEIGIFIEKINEELKKTFEKYEIICVNDFSSDNSVNTIKEIAEKNVDAPVTIINMSYKHGLEMAMVAGCDLAIGDFIYEFDTCFIDYPIEMIKNVYFKSLEGNDIVAASPTSRSIGSGIFYNIFNKVSGKKLYSERFRILSRRAINRISQNTDNIIYRKAVYYNSGLPYANIKYKPILKETPNSDFLYKQGLAIDSLIAFTSVGYKISVTSTLFMMILSIFFILYAISIKLFGINTSGGWATLVCIISTSFFMLFGVLSIIIKYLSLIFKHLNIKRQYVFDSINKINKNCI